MHACGAGKKEKHKEMIENDILILNSMFSELIEHDYSDSKNASEAKTNIKKQTTLLLYSAL